MLPNTVLYRITSPHSHSAPSLSLVSPLGIKYKAIQSEKWLHRKYFGEYLMMKQRRTLAAQQECDFYDRREDSPHR